MQLRRWGVLLLGLALALGSTHVAFAQVTTSGSIEVVLEDPQGGRLPGVSVTASANDVVTTRTAVTDAQGVATLRTLAPSTAYTVKATLPGFRDFEQSKILVRSGETTSIHAQLGLATVTEQVEVTVASPVVDVKRSIAGADLTLQLTESLPTGRSYQSYLQLVPGVLPDSGLSTGNPASRSAMNWKDVITNDNLGISQENAYYFEGINVTDPVTGTFGANLNTEIIQEQKVITGGIPAEYVGAGSLISTIITKSGSNTFHGSGTEFFQNDKLQAKDKHFGSTKFDQYDSAFTIGGPVWKNKLWGFGSFRYLPKTQDVSAQDTLLFLRSVKTTSKQGFAKGTWAATQNDMISFMFLNDPQTRSGDTDPTVPNSRIRQRNQGGNNVSATYNRVAGSRLLLQGAFNYHNAAISDFAVDRTTRNTIAYQTGDVRTLAQEQLGGFGQDAPETRPTKAGSFSAEYQWGAHRLKGGMEFVQHEDHRNLIYTGDGGQYTSLASQYLGATAACVSSTCPFSTRQFRSTTASDFTGLIATINTLPNKAQFYSAYDTNGDGTITAAEFGAAAVFNSTAGNPTPGDVNYYRIFESAQGPQDLNQRGLSWYGQDEFTMNRFTFNVGVRSERWTHYDTNGTKTFAYPWTWAPRLSVAYDVNGDGRQKVSAYYGKYYEPVRMDMTQFTGTATGATRQEQIYIQNQWVTYRTRGGPTTIDGFFSPGAKTPYTAEFQLQHEIDLGNQMSVSSTYYYRAVRDIFEDFDPALYTVASAYPGSTTDPTLFLGWNYFGWSNAVHPGQGLPNANFFLGTLPGGQRNYHGLEFVARKRFADSWQMLTSYNYLHAMGNAVSVGNADFAGDVLWLDPRAPNLYGVVPGTVHHLFKTGATYTTKFGLEVGGSYSWNSGSIVNKTQLASSRRLPIEGDNTAAFGITSAKVASDVGGWVAPGAVGATQNPSWGKIDARVSYTRKFGAATTAFFFDVFDLTNGQPATRIEDLAAGTGTTKYGDQIAWRQPRRASLGARISF